MERAREEIVRLEGAIRVCVARCEGADGDPRNPEAAFTEDGAGIFGAVRCSRCGGTESDEVCCGPSDKRLLPIGSTSVDKMGNTARIRYYHNQARILGLQLLSSSSSQSFGTGHHICSCKVMTDHCPNPRMR
eukprot:evm.model.scf_980.2 EVM.evm.TU.scf_980.2   scf_980:5081-5476(+)